MFRNLKPVTPSLRHSFLIIKKLNSKPLLKNKLRNLNQSLGKNNAGKIVVRFKGGGVKKRYRTIDFKRNKSMNGVVCSLEHDPFRSSFIMSLFDTSKKKFLYSLAPEGVMVGDSIETGASVPQTAGNSAPLKNFPAGSLVSNLTVTAHLGGQLARSAGSYGLVRGHLEEFSFVELMSGEIRLISNENYAQLGKISNDTHFLEQMGKAGRARWKGRRPHVRGVAMNPVDHPNGGGEGKKSGPRRNPWGRLNKKKLNKKSNPFIFKSRNG